MYINSAYLNSVPGERINTEQALVNTEQPLLVTACGTYRLKHQPLLYTYRPNGRSDYQILYVASGKTHFFFDGVQQIIPAGNIVVFRPDEPQLYKYFGEDQPEVYWVHFTGFEAEKYLRDYNLWDTRVISVTPSSNWKRLFRHMIQELQLRKDLYPELLVNYLKELILLLHRQVLESNLTSKKSNPTIEQAIRFFNENYAADIQMNEYAKEHHLSISWFTRCFKQYTGLPPTQYLLSLRIQNAQSLLENSTYNISEIASMVGFHDPLYFSRLFKKQVGVSPEHYRSQIMN